MKVLLTGGAGYIGTHTAISLIEAGHSVVIIDNLGNSSEEAVRRVRDITGADIPFYEADVRDESCLDDIFTTYSVDAVIHFAGLKAVGESVEKPLVYYQNNLNSTLVLLAAMQRHAVTNLVFSSSATVYGIPSELPLTEDSTVGIGLTNPYGKTKYMLEEILRDFSTANPDFHMTILRYFNPVGAHISGRIGEDPQGIPNNLLPFVAQVAVGTRETVMVFGDDYDTPVVPESVIISMWLIWQRPRSSIRARPARCHDIQPWHRQRNVSARSHPGL
jgi:UDP-glucose 4-epimerase